MYLGDLPPITPKVHCHVPKPRPRVIATACPLRSARGETLGRYHFWEQQQKTRTASGFIKPIKSPKLFLTSAPLAGVTRLVAGRFSRRLHRGLWPLMHSTGPLTGPVEGFWPSAKRIAYTTKDSLQSVPRQCRRFVSVFLPSVRIIYMLFMILSETDGFRFRGSFRCFVMQTFSRVNYSRVGSRNKLQMMSWFRISP